ncbi:MAG: patatin-like phospholipase family protein [Archangium sp.]|nr:patatin-like phospholipase family protein [Archangium sp.]MDP3570557.1 patatin-like phospholipase family protein [Archangium sp.]
MKTALVLSGGGARGAYEAGVISFLRNDLEPRLGRPLRLDILCGTSVGALTACALAATADRPSRQGLELVRFWSKISLKQVLRFGVTDLVRTLREQGGGGLANPDGMRELVGAIEWRNIGRNIRNGLLEALSICATRVSDGRTTLFVQQDEPLRPVWLENPHFEAMRARIGPRHALASAAMPVLFSPVELGGQLYLDGGLRMNVPVSPALRLGAQRVVVISLQPQASPSRVVPPMPVRPTALFLAGKAINSLLQDRLDQDVENMRRINSIIEEGSDAFGADFTNSMNRALDAYRTFPLRYVRNMLVRPSRDLGAIAAQCVRSHDFLLRHPQVPGLFLSLLGGHASQDSADLASYLLFDPGFAEELIALGRSDARAHEDGWARFFDDAPICDAEAAELDRAAFTSRSGSSATLAARGIG